MPVFIPVVEPQAPSVTVAVVFAGATTLTVNPTVSLHAPVTFNGATALVVTGQNTLAGQVSLDGATQLVVNGRLNADADVFGSVTFAGATALSVTAQGNVTSPVTFAGQTQLVVSLVVQAAISFGFTIFVDVTDASLQSALTNNIRRYRARLVVDGVEIPIIRAQLQAPSDKLGTELTVVLADPNVSAVTATSSINFDIALWVSGAWLWINLLQGGKLSQRSARYVNEEGLPRDAVELSIVDIIGDRWNRAPRQQVFMYNSAIIDAPTGEAVQSETVYTTQGVILPPLYIGLPGLSLQDVLNYAYVTGCGFDRALTNIPNFPVEQVSFTMVGGYDAGVRGLLQTFSPVVFASGNDLWIIDPDQPLPSGVSAVDFVAAFSASIDDVLPAHEPVNGLLVRLNDFTGGVGEDFFTERLETSTIRTGDNEQDTERRIREYRAFSDPTKIVREEVAYTRTRILDSTFNVISIETRTDHFDILNRPTGYSLSVEMLLPDISNPLVKILQTVTSEEQFITYVPDPLHPTQDIQSRIETHTSGLILVDAGNQYLGKNYRIPYIDAHKSGYITGEQQTVEFGLIRTVIEQLSFNGGQVRYETRVTNHIADVPDKITVKTLPGSAQVNRSLSAHYRYILLTVPGTDSTSRRVAEFDASLMPYATALAIGQRRLNNLNNPLKELAVTMSYVNPGLRRGATIHVQGRSGYLGNYIVKGYMIIVEGIDLKTYKASMTFQARELRVI